MARPRTEPVYTRRATRPFSGFVQLRASLGNIPTAWPGWHGQTTRLPVGLVARASCPCILAMTGALWLGKARPRWPRDARAGRPRHEATHSKQHRQTSWQHPRSLKLGLCRRRRRVAASRPKALAMANGQTIAKLRLTMPPKTRELRTSPTSFSGAIHGRYPVSNRVHFSVGRQRQNHPTKFHEFSMDK
jgi:hypothetical protein